MDDVITKPISATKLEALLYQLNLIWLTVYIHNYIALIIFNYSLIISY
jgi:hypothetical protein